MRLLLESAYHFRLTRNNKSEVDICRRLHRENHNFKLQNIPNPSFIILEFFQGGKSETSGDLAFKVEAFMLCLILLKRKDVKREI